jgi:hypothetical protein
MPNQDDRLDLWKLGSKPGEEGGKEGGAAGEEVGEGFASTGRVESRRMVG